MKGCTFAPFFASLFSIGSSYAQTDEDKYADPRYSRSADFRSHSPDKDEGLFVVQPHFFTNLEFLYWTVNTGSLDYAIKMNNPAWSTVSTFPTGDIEHASYDWDPGFRVALGFFNASKFWEIVAEYTWLYVNGKDSVNQPSAANEFLNPSLTVALQNPFDSASSNIRFHYNLAELMITRVFDPNPHLRLRLYGGGIVPWFKQKWTVVYSTFT